MKEVFEYPEDVFEDRYAEGKPVYVYNFIKSGEKMKAEVVKPFVDPPDQFGLISEWSDGEWVPSQYVEGGFKDF